MTIKIFEKIKKIIDEIIVEEIDEAKKNNLL
jgi:hypothetical protein